MDEEEVIIIVKDGQFALNKQALCEHSDYFRAMFSGNFKEHDQQEITLDIVDATSMKLIIIYLKGIRYIQQYLHQCPTIVIGNLAEAANLLQFTELSITIECVLLDKGISTKNWMEVINIAEQMNYTKFKQAYADFGLPPLRNMEIQYVPSIQNLVWYLSQTHLYVINEYDVFKFGLDWMSHSNTDVDSHALMMFLGCLDMKRVTTKNLVDIKIVCLSLFCFGFSNNLIAKVIDCLTEISKNNAITNDEIVSKETMIKEKYTEAVYDEVLRLVECSRSRQIEHTPIVPVHEMPKEPIMSRYYYKFKIIMDSIRVDAGFNLYTFTDSGFEKWLELNIPTKNNNYYFTWSVAAWGPRNIVLVVSKGKIGTADNVRNQDDNDLNKLNISVYNVLKKEWTSHNAELPKGMVRRVAVVRDSLYIICGDGYDIIYDLMEKTYKTITKPPCKLSEDPDIETRMPLICAHDDQVYLCDLNIVYKYEEDGNKWVEVIKHYTQITNMVSHDDGYIYVTDDAPDNNLRRFKPGQDQRLFAVKSIAMDEFGPIINSCSLGDRIMFFTNKSYTADDHDSPSLSGLKRIFFFFF